MNGVETVRVASDETGLRLDRWFKRHFPEITHARLEKWLRQGQVRVDGGRAKASLRLQADQEIRLPPLGDAASPRPSRAAVEPTVNEADSAALAARVLHADNQVIVLDKPAGLAVQGGTGIRRHLDAMLSAFALGGERPRLVHRLDKDTSGVLVLARNAAAAASLTGAFRAKDVRKLYWAVVVGVPNPAEGRIDIALSKLPGRGGERMAADSDHGLRAITDYRIVERAGRRAAWLALEPLTGRTHQLRVHCAALGTPILADGKYGGAGAFLEGTALARGLHLHARAIRFPHPSGKTLAVTAPLPDHMAATWRFFGFTDENACAADLAAEPASATASRKRLRRNR
jgi:23S rRNA pseudouridine955/2504/2580 synthase